MSFPTPAKAGGEICCCESSRVAKSRFLVAVAHRNDIALRFLVAVAHRNDITFFNGRLKLSDARHASSVSGQ